jgi:hypothetical protein
MVNQDSDMQNWCRSVWTLCFVPEKDVLAVWTDIVVKAAPYLADPEDPDYDDCVSPEDVIQWNTALDKYIQYLEYTWLGRVSPKTGKRGPGLYKIPVWNKFEEVRQGDVDLTSNRFVIIIINTILETIIITIFFGRSEAFNSAMKISSRMKPNLWALLKQLQDEESLNSYKIANALGAHPLKDDHPGRTRRRLERAEQLAKIVCSWGTISTEAYIKALASHFTFDE